MSRPWLFFKLLVFVWLCVERVISACEIQRTASTNLFSHCIRWTLRIKFRSWFLLASALAHYAILPVPFLFKKERSKQTNERKEEGKNKREGGREEGREGGGKSLKKTKTQYLFHVSVPEFMYVHQLCASAHREWKRTSDSLTLEA